MCNNYKVKIQIFIYEIVKNPSTIFIVTPIYKFYGLKLVVSLKFFDQLRVTIFSLINNFQVLKMQHLNLPS